MSTESKLRRALEELVDIVEGVIASGRATGLVDSFTLQPAREALAATQQPARFNGEQALTEFEAKHGGGK